MSRASIEAIVFLLLMAACFYAGDQHGQKAQAVFTNAATRDKDTCIDAASAKQTVLDQVKTQLQQDRDQHALMLRDATAAIADRDNEIQTLQKAAKTAQSATTKAAHEDPDCVSLAKLGVCPAIARQLWPVPAAPDSRK